jgi:hypothetical protein
LKIGSDAKWQYEFLRIEALHVQSGETLAFITDGDFWPKEDSEDRESRVGKNGKKTKKMKKSNGETAPGVVTSKMFLEYLKIQ